jgi:elongation factor G
MERDFKLHVRVGKPRVSYRETLRTAIRVVGECIKQAPGSAAGQFARLTVEFEPYRGDEPVLVRTRLKPGLLPAEFVAAAEAGVRGALDSGELGYPVMNVQATIVDAEMDEQLSSEVAFAAAGADAVRRAMRDNMMLLEPWMKILVIVPNEYGGAIIGDINARKGEIDAYELGSETGVTQIVAHAPLANLFDYIDAVRSLSQGRAAPTMEPWAYKPAPEEVMHRLLHPEDYY